MTAEGSGRHGHSMTSAPVGSPLTSDLVSDSIAVMPVGSPRHSLVDNQT